PVSALALIYLALFLRVMLSGMAEALKFDFVLFSRAKGLSRSRIVLCHVARNGLLLLVSTLGRQSAHMLGGSVLIE
ncbi:ABC transporter permease subunit, partial [Rhizobium ruizarguesonis]